MVPLFSLSDVIYVHIMPETTAIHEESQLEAEPFHRGIQRREMKRIQVLDDIMEPTGGTVSEACPNSIHPIM